MNRSMMIQLSLLGLSLVVMLGGILLQSKIKTRQHPDLLNLVEEISPAGEVNDSGQKLVIDQDTGIALDITETVF